MINDVDDALRNLIREEALRDTDVEVVLEAPTRDWASRRNGPSVNVYLYDIREDVSRRTGNTIAVRRDDGKVAGYRTPPRVFRMAYLVTAWTQRPDDEHRLLSSLLSCFLRYEIFPTRLMSPALIAQGYPVGVSIAQPSPDNRKVSEVWSALGGDLKASLDVLVTMTVDVGLFTKAAAEIMKPMRLQSSGIGTFPDLVDDPREARLPAELEPATAASEAT